MTNKILITGMSGLLGTALRKEIKTDYELSALNRSELPGVTTTRASLDNYDDILPAFSNIDTVVHLAAEISDKAGWQKLLSTNIEGTRNVFEAARVSGIRRVVFASSGATVSGWENDEPYKSLVSGDNPNGIDESRRIDESMAVRPGGIYGATKVWGEGIGRHYADAYGIEVICLRIGYANETDRPEGSRHFSVWNSQRDVVQAFRLAIAMNVAAMFDTFFILSDNKLGYRNIDRARSVLGYQPMDAAENYR